MSTRFTTEPRFHEGPGVAVSAVVRPADTADEIEVVVVFSRSSGQPPMNAGDVDAEFSDRDNRVFPVVSRPQGDLPEAGGMGVSVNAPFRFRAEDRSPAKLKVRYRGDTYTFRVEEAG